VSAKVISIREGTCRSTQKRIDAFLDDELPAHAMRWFLRHLARCRDCGQELERRDRVKKRTKAAVYGQTAPPGLVIRIIDRIREENARVTPWLSETKNPV
jgi:anti-sigma factor (TIGR02949 family)